MKKVLIITGLICFLAVPSVAVFGACNPEKSPTKVVATMEGKDVAFCSLKEAYVTAFVERKGAKADDLNNRAIAVVMKDFQSGKMFNFYEGFYIINHTMGKNTLGFSNRERAWSFWEDNVKKIGGRVVNFESATREHRKSDTGPSAKNKKKQAAAAAMVEFLLKKKN